MFLYPTAFLASSEAMNRVWSREQSLAYTRWLATHHYENFHVVSLLLPKRLHQDFYNVYSFCRWADDLGDEIGDTAESLRLLAWWRGELHAMAAGQVRHPVFVALAGTARRYSLPVQTFDHLITAFEQDQTVTRYASFDQLLHYCRYSANPVGRLVLGLCGYHDPERQALSDATCTALQLANFWQDVIVDLEKGRVYLPLDLLAAHNYPLEALFARRFDDRFRGAMQEAVTLTRQLFLKGLPLADAVDRRLAIDLELFSRGGLRVLEKIERQGCDVLSSRPAVSKMERVGLLLSAISRRVFSRGGLTAMTTGESYAYCQRVARTQAKNFYYSFLLLSRPQRQAMCAMYAFMRYCDDLSDAEDVADRPAAIAGWQQDLDAALAGRPSDHPLWPAFCDAVQRYSIPHEYFHAMIRGVSSDLEPRRVQTFQELYDYCYHVASVVGLTIIHIFGFDDPQALQLAERCGVAFQLTNILRDVREDAANGRIYLPAEDLARFGVQPEELSGRDLSPALRALLAFEADRAREYYRQAQPLTGLVHRGSRGSLQALIGIYARLLERISEGGYEVLAQRVRVPAWEKLWILTRCAL